MQQQQWRHRRRRQRCEWSRAAAKKTHRLHCAAQRRAGRSAAAAAAATAAPGLLACHPIPVWSRTELNLLHSAYIQPHRDPSHRRRRRGGGGGVAASKHAALLQTDCEVPLNLLWGRLNSVLCSHWVVKGPAADRPSLYNIFFIYADWKCVTIISCKATRTSLNTIRKHNDASALQV